MKMSTKKVVPKKRRKQKPHLEFTSHQKIRLAQLVEEHPHLWRLDHPLHRNKSSTQSAWEELALEIGETGKILTMHHVPINLACKFINRFTKYSIRHTHVVQFQLRTVKRLGSHCMMETDIE